MNDQDKIAEQAAEIANLNKVVSHLKAEITNLMGDAAKAALPSVAVARDLMPKRSAFIAWCEQRGLETVEDRDAWGKRKFKHSHIEALWEGWFNAPDGMSGDRNAALEEAAMICDRLAKLYDAPNVGYDNGCTMGATRAAQEIRAIKCAAAASVPPTVPPCPACGGSGETVQMSGGGPDAYEIPANCPHCNGTGGLDDAYRGVVALLTAEQRKYLEACAKSYFRPEIAQPAAPLPELTGPSDPSALGYATEALRFYADQCHFTMHQPDAWDTVSGEPINFYEDESNTATVEDGSVAKMALETIAGAPRIYPAASPSPAPAQPTGPSNWRRIAKESAHHLEVWLEQDDCDCEGGHTCGKPLVQATLHDLKEVLSAAESIESVKPAAPGASIGDDPEAVRCDWEPCNPGCDLEFNGMRSRHCTCDAARASIARQRATAAEQSTVKTAEG